MIREATPADRPRLRALQASLASPCPGLLDLAVGDTPGSGGPVALVAAPGDSPGGPTGDDPAGYVLAVPGTPPDGDDRPASGDAVSLAEVVVAPDRRREGHGTALVEAAAARFAGRDRLLLTVRADDDRALAFYRANGFRAVDELPGHYGENGSGDALVLARDLTGG